MQKDSWIQPKALGPITARDMFGDPPYEVPDIMYWAVQFNKGESLSIIRKRLIEALQKQEEKDARPS